MTVYVIELNLRWISVGGLFVIVDKVLQYSAIAAPGGEKFYEFAMSGVFDGLVEFGPAQHVRIALFVPLDAVDGED